MTIYSTEFTYNTKYLNYICIMDKLSFIYDYVHVAPEQQIALHSHPRWELSHVIHGSGTRVIGDKTEAISEGEIVFLPPGIPHVWQFDSASVDDDGCVENITVLFDTKQLDSLAMCMPELKVAVTRIKLLTEARSFYGEIRQSIAELLYNARGKTADARIPDMIKLILLLAVSDQSIGVGRDNTLGRIGQRLENVRTFCACNYARDVCLDEVAAYAGMNKSAFCTFMRRHTGKTFSEYINDYRLNLAIERLEFAEDNIADIAYSVGFSNVTYFNRLFRARFGCTPKSMRNGKNHKHNI